MKIFIIDSSDNFINGEYYINSNDITPMNILINQLNENSKDIIGIIYNVEEIIQQEHIKLNFENDCSNNYSNNYSDNYSNSKYFKVSFTMYF